jgi:hypothetical protein
MAGTPGSINDQQYGASVTLGLQDISDQQFETMSKFGDFTYQTPPATGFATRHAQQRVERLIGGMNPKFTPDQFDRIRERLQVVEKRERDAHFEAIAQCYIQQLAMKFRKAEGVDHAEFERMLRPGYMPKYFHACRALGVRPPMVWRQQMYESLENLSRLPLDKCEMETREAQFTFEEWYSLFWNYYMPFNSLAYACVAVGQTMVYTEEMVHELATHMRHRLETAHAGARGVSSPILHLGCPLGKLAGLLNETKILPVPVIAVHEKPKTNPYLAKIPAKFQPEFKLRPIEKLKAEAALEKYNPCMVLMSDLPANADTTQVVRGHGSVREYMILGMPESYVEGHGWDTWGTHKYRPADDKTKLPPYNADGFKKFNVHHVSRYMLTRFDSNEIFGLGACTSFTRFNLVPDFKTRMGYWARRLATRY